MRKIAILTEETSISETRQMTNIMPFTSMKKAVEHMKFLADRGTALKNYSEKMEINKISKEHYYAHGYDNQKRAVDYYVTYHKIF